MSDKIRVLVVDDSALMRLMISDILNSDKEIEVVATARDGEDGIIKVTELRPDVVTLDIEMPRLDGLHALGYIMSEIPTPVVIPNRSAVMASIPVPVPTSKREVSPPVGNNSVSFNKYSIALTVSREVGC